MSGTTFLISILVLFIFVQVVVKARGDNALANAIAAGRAGVPDPGIVGITNLIPTL